MGKRTGPRLDISMVCDGGTDTITWSIEGITEVQSLVIGVGAPWPSRLQPLLRRKLRLDSNKVANHFGVSPATIASNIPLCVEGLFCFAWGYCNPIGGSWKSWNGSSCLCRVPSNQEIRYESLWPAQDPIEEGEKRLEKYLPNFRSTPRIVILSKWLNVLGLSRHSWLVEALNLRTYHFVRHTLSASQHLMKNFWVI